MKGDQDRKEQVGGDHLVRLTRQAIVVLKALWPLELLARRHLAK